MSTQFVTAGDGVALAFERIGAGTPLVLVHGFSSSRAQNWADTGWYAPLVQAGFCVVAMDCRGHGQSGKPHDPEAYGHDRMSEDVAAVMDAAGIARAHLFGYSMGGFIGIRFAARFGARLERLVLGGVGAHYFSGPRLSAPGRREVIAEALLAPDKAAIADPVARVFRAFADEPGKDRVALAACMRAMSPPLPASALAAIAQPVLVVDGARDDVAGAPEPLAAAFPNGHAVTVPGRDHMSAVGDRNTRAAVLDFLTGP